MEIKEAIEIAQKAHFGQVDKCGKPYILHPINVSFGVYTKDEKVVAILHDVLEDTNITMDVLDEKGISDIQREALILLTHKSKIQYQDYIEKLASNDIARAVKISDLRHNMNPYRIIIGESSVRIKKRIEKYGKALDYLLNYKKQ